MERKHGQNRIEILQCFLENPEKILTTAEITEVTGINKSVVSRELKALTEQMQIQKIKAGQYRLVDVAVSSKWTREDNQKTIDFHLNFYDAYIFPTAHRWIMIAMMKGDFDQAIAILKGLMRTVDILLHRWAIEHQGYDNNPEQARQDVKLAKALEPPPEEDEEDNRIRGWDPVNKKFLD